MKTANVDPLLGTPFVAFAGKSKRWKPEEMVVLLSTLKSVFVGKVVEVFGRR